MSDRRKPRVYTASGWVKRPGTDWIHRSAPLVIGPQHRSVLRDHLRASKLVAHALDPQATLAADLTVVAR